MFVVVPVHHDDLSLRRWPLVTTVIALLCGALWAYTLHIERGLDDEKLTLVREAATLSANHPGSPMSDELAAYIQLDDEARYRSAIPGKLEDTSDSPVERIAEIDSRLTTLASSDPRAQAAFGRAELRTPTRAVASVFAHLSWPHIVFNLWFLFVAGLALEDRLGRGFFALFYLVAGVFSAYVHTLMSPLPVIGASGAISACIGLTAFLNPRESGTVAVAGLLPMPASFVRARGAGIGLFGLLPLTLGYRSFSAPLIVLGLLFVGTELWADFAANDGSVAHWAHIGGFAFGCTVALILKASGLDKRLLAVTEQKSFHSQDMSAPRALAASGRYAEALAGYRALLKRREVDQITIEDELLRLAPKLPPAEASRVYADVLRARTDQLRNPLDAYQRIEAQGGQDQVPPALRMRLVAKASIEDPYLALRILDGLAEAFPVSNSTVHARLARAEFLLARRQGHDSDRAKDDIIAARDLIELAPECRPLLARLSREVGLATSMIPSSGLRQ